MEAQATQSRAAHGHRLSLKGYASILRAVAVRPRKADEVATIIGYGRTSVHRILVRMEELGIVYVRRWSPSKKGPATAVYSFGAKSSAEYPGKVIKHPCGSWNRRTELMAFANAIKAMMEGPSSTADICELSGLSRGAVRSLLAHCQDISLVRIGDWYMPPAGPPAPMYAVGSGADAPRPDPQPAGEVWKRCYQRRMARRQMQTMLSAMSGATA
jgi:hypothetical protein